LALWLIAMAALLALMVWPLQLSRWLGVVATTLLGLGLWAAVLGLLMAQLQDQRPLPIFATLRL
jgi:hypothetical protein